MQATVMVVTIREMFICSKLEPNLLEMEFRTFVRIQNVICNKFICIQGKSVFCEALCKKGLITLQDLTTEENGVITVFQILASASLTPLKEKFQLMAIIEAIPTKWRHHLKTCNNYQNNSTCSNSAQYI